MYLLLLKDAVSLLLDILNDSGSARISAQCQKAINLSTAPPTNIELFERSFLSKLVSFSTSARTISLNLDTSFSAFFQPIKPISEGMYIRVKRRESRLPDGVEVATAFERRHDFFYGRS
jgi:hypothetical protein